MPYTKHTIHHSVGSSIIVAPVARSQKAQATQGVTVSVEDVAIVGKVVAITIVCPEGALMVTLDEDQAAAFAVQLATVQLAHAQSLDRSAVQ